MNARLKAACDALSEDIWDDITGAMQQRDHEFCCNAKEREAGQRDIELVAELIEALRGWRKEQA